MLLGKRSPSSADTEPEPNGGTAAVMAVLSAAGAARSASRTWSCAVILPTLQSVPTARNTVAEIKVPEQ